MVLFLIHFRSFTSCTICVAPVFRMPKYMFSDMFLSICAGIGVKCTRNVSSIQLLTVLYVSIHSTSQFVLLSNALNIVSGCTRLVHASTQHEKWQSNKNRTRKKNPRLFHERVCMCVCVFVQLLRTLRINKEK